MQCPDKGKLTGSLYIAKRLRSKQNCVLRNNLKNQEFGILLILKGNNKKNISLKTSR